MLFCLAGCEQKESDTVTEFEAAPPFSPLTEIKEGRKNIYLIIKTLNSDYWDVVVDGAKAGGENFDCNVYYSGCNIENDWESQSRLMEEAVAAGADALLLSPNDSVRLSAEIEKVYSQGVKIVLVDTIAITDSYDVCYMTDNLMAGQLASAEMISQLHEKGYSDDENIQVGVQVCATATQTINERLAGFLQYWSNNAPDNWTVISDIKFNEGDVDRGCQCTEDLLNNMDMKTKLLDYTVAMLVNQKEIELEEMAGIEAKFGYFMDIKGHGLEALFKMIKNEKVWYFALQQQSLKLLTINEAQFQQVPEDMIRMHLSED